MTSIATFGRTIWEKPAAGPSPPSPRSTRKCWFPYGTSRRMAMGLRSPFQFWNERDVAIDGEIVHNRARESVPFPIEVSGSNRNPLRLFPGEICRAGIEKRTNGTCGCEKLDVAK